MKRSTAVGHLVRLAEESTRYKEMRFGDPFPVAELWVAGEILDPATDTLDRVTVVLKIDRPPEEIPWLTRPDVVHFLDDVLRLNKNPILRVYRPAAWPAWNPQFRDVVRFWSRADGLSEIVIEQLRRRRRPPVQVPDEAEFLAQMETELEVSRVFLDGVLDAFYESEWRGEHKGSGIYPGDHLWWVAAGYREIEKIVTGR